MRRPRVSNKRYRLSINRHIIDKHKDGDTRFYAEGFENERSTIEELADEVRRGHAFAPELAGCRRAENFRAADLIPVDLDHPCSIDEVLRHPLIQAAGVLVYTTASHTDERPRFRVVLATAETITDSPTMRALMRSAMLRLNGDPAATDPTRIAFGNRAAKVWLFPDRRMPPDLQAELIAQSKQVAAHAQGGRAHPSVRSALRLRRDLQVKLATGQVLAFGKIVGKQPVHCPFHRDQRPSAYTVFGRRGGRGIHCAVCRSTFWCDEPADDFPCFDEAILRTAAEHDENVAQGPVAALFDLNGPANITIVEEGTGLVKITPGLTLVKAPKGAGKTEAIKRLLPDVGSALYVVHRRTLTRQSCLRLGLPCYLDFGWLGGDGLLGVCLDSIVKLPDDAQFELIVVDEVEQVLLHFSADTIDRADRRPLFDKFTRLLQRAKHVVAMDADLGWTSFMTLTRLTGVGAAQADLFRSARVLYSRAKPGDGKTVEVFSSRQHLLEELKIDVLAGKRVFVATNTKKLANEIASMLKSVAPEVRQLLLTADNSSGEEQSRFLSSPATSALDHDAIITSPAVGTGIDMTFAGNASMIDVVFGFCQSGINAHSEFGQHIGRVRHPKAVKVWVTPERRFFETHADVVKRELLERVLTEKVVLGHETSEPTHVDSDALLEMAVLAESQRRRSMNDLKKNFIEHKRAQGFSINFVRTDPTKSAHGRELLKIASELGDQEYRDRLLHAQRLDLLGFERLREAVRAGAKVSAEDRLALERTRVEGFYRAPISAELIERDQRGRTRERIVLYEDLTKHLTEEKPAPLPRDANIVREREHRVALLRNLLETTPLVNDGKWDADAIFSGDDLESFCDAIEKHKRPFETQLGRQIRSDIRQKPAQQLGHILRMLGLSLQPFQTKREGDRKLYFYRLDRQALADMRQISATRAALTRADFLAEHGVAADDDEALAFFEEEAA
jgi:Origin of replication binding protein